jgi:hypothetical protein
VAEVVIILLRVYPRRIASEHERWTTLAAEVMLAGMQLKQGSRWYVLRPRNQSDCHENEKENSRFHGMRTA